MIHTKLIDRFLRKGKGPGWDILTDDGKAYYRENAIDLRQKLKDAQKFHLGNVEPWRDFDGEKLSEDQIYLAYNPMVLQFHLPVEDYKIEGGILFHGQHGAGIEMELFAISPDTHFGQMINRFHFDTATEKWIGLDDDFLKIAVLPAQLKPGDGKLLDEAKRLNTLRINANDLVLAGIFAIAIMNEGGTKETVSGYTERRKEEREARKAGVVYKRLTIDLEKTSTWTHKGGTHASPRFHKRRGHWRHYQDGKKVWIGPMDVGKKEDGEVIKEYEVKPVSAWEKIIAKMKSFVVKAA